MMFVKEGGRFGEIKREKFCISKLSTLSLRGLNDGKRKWPDEGEIVENVNKAWCTGEELCDVFCF